MYSCTGWWTAGGSGDRQTDCSQDFGWGHFSSVQLLSRVQLFATPWTAARQISLSITNSWSLFKLMSSELVIPSNHLILCRPLLLPPSIFPSIRVFSHESVLCIRWPKYWSFSFNTSPSNEHPGLISFRMDWLDLLAVQGTFKSLLQHHSSKASVLWHSAFFIVQLSHPYMTTGKTIALTRWTFVGKVMSLLFNMLSRLVITFLPRSKMRLTGFLGLCECGLRIDRALPLSQITHTSGTLHRDMNWIVGKGRTSKKGSGRGQKEQKGATLQSVQWPQALRTITGPPTWT